MFNLKDLLSIKDLFGGSKKIVGLDIGSSFLKLVEISVTSKGYMMNLYSQLSLPKGVIIDGGLVEHEVLTEKIKELFKQSKCRVRSVATSLSGNSVIVKRVNLLRMEETEVRDMIRDEASKYLPFDNMNEVNFDFQILGENEYNPNQMDVLLVAAKQDIINGYVEAIENAGLSVVIMDIDSFALGNMYEENYDFEENDVVVLVNIGASITNINVVKNGATIFVRDFNLGGNTITEAIQEKLGIAFEEAEKIKIEVSAGDAEAEGKLGENLLIYADPVCQEIERSVDYFRSTSGGENIKQVLLSGGSANIPGLAAELSQRLNIPSEIINPFNKINYNTKSLDQAYIESIGSTAAVGIGLALRRVGDR